MQRNKSIDFCIRRVYLVEGAVFCRLNDSLASPVKKMSDIPLQDTELEMYDILDIILNISDSFYYCNIIFNSIYDVIVVALLFYVHGKHLRSCRDGYDVINKISIMDYKHIRYLLYYMTSVRYLVYLLHLLHCCFTYTVNI